MVTWLLALLIILGIFLFTDRRYRWIYILYKTLPRDLKAIRRWAILNLTLRKWEMKKETIPKIFEKLVNKHPDKVAFYFEDEKWTYKMVSDFSNQVANYYKKDYKKGDTVALILESRPEFVGLWLGLSKLGVVTALINTNLTSDPLFHTINVSNAKAIIFGSNLANAVNGISSKLGNSKLYQFNVESTPATTVNGSINIKEELKSQSKVLDGNYLEKGRPRDQLIYIYTSGTTGLPKAAVISHLRYMTYVVGIHFMVDIREDDIIYNSLPLYHSAGGMVGVGQCILFGTAMALRKKFSASNFWLDCKKYNCTIAQYIGEICRYLLSAHKEHNSVEHSVKKMVGNGLRPQIWRKFADTFKIEQIFEFYGATEGNTNLVNIDNKEGSCGFVPRYARAAYPLTLIKCDEQTSEPIRNSKGLCIPCKVGEPGVIIGKIKLKNAVNNFTGYADEKATEKKMIRNVLAQGDLYFNSGDVLVQDEFGYYYFRDRTGDTYRWKGENVATNEIEAVVSNIMELKDSLVYGVEVPDTEGRAGMVAIVDPNNTLDKEKLFKGLKANLPSYAVPIFLRIIEKVPITGTFKLKKNDLQKEGFDVEKIEDKLYFLDSKNSTYNELTKELYNNILAGVIKL